MVKRASLALLLCSTTLALVLSAAVAQGSINEVNYTVRDMAFEGPDTLPAGMTTITFDNETDRDDTYALITLGGGRSLDEFFTTMGMLFSGELAVIPDWINFHGGSPIGAGDSRTYSIFLSPGTHYLLSIEGDEEGPFAARGALLPISVEAPAVDADVTITLQDYEFVIDGTLAAGSQIVRVHNAANQPHELFMIPLPPGMSIEDMFAAEEAAGEHDEHAEEGGGPDVPASAIQGLWALNPGETAYVRVTLEGGTTYGIVCFIPDADGPHALQGMAQEVVID